MILIFFSLYKAEHCSSQSNHLRLASKVSHSHVKLLNKKHLKPCSVVLGSIVFLFICIFIKKKKKRMLVKLKVRGTGSTFVLFGTFLMSKVSDK